MFGRAEGLLACFTPPASVGGLEPWTHSPLGLVPPPFTTTPLEPGGWVPFKEEGDPRLGEG